MHNRANTALARPLPNNFRQAEHFTNRALRGTGVRRNLAHLNQRVFTANWWNTRRHLWHHHRWHWCHHRPGMWWRWANWVTINRWLYWSWSQPYVYEYNINVVYEDDYLFMNEEAVSTMDDYLSDGEELASVDRSAVTPSTSGSCSTSAGK